MRSTVLLSLTMALLPTCFAQNQPAASAQTAAPTAAQPQTVSPIDQGLNYLKSNHPDKALAVFQKILQDDPDNATANLLAASAALNLYQGATAVTYAEKARQLAPNAWQVDTTLVTAYASADKTPGTRCRTHQTRCFA